MTKPIDTAERLNIVDILRGFALIGVVISNVFPFNMPPHADPASYDAVTLYDQIASYLARTIVIGKFYTLFSFLFGLSFSLQIARLKEKAAPVMQIYLRRLTILLIIGYTRYLSGPATF